MQHRTTTTDTSLFHRRDECTLIRLVGITLLSLMGCQKASEHSRLQRLESKPTSSSTTSTTAYSGSLQLSTQHRTHTEAVVSNVQVYVDPNKIASALSALSEDIEWISSNEQLGAYIVPGRTNMCEARALLSSITHTINCDGALLSYANRCFLRGDKVLAYIILSNTYSTATNPVTRETCIFKLQEVLEALGNNREQIELGHATLRTHDKNSFMYVPTVLSMAVAYRRDNDYRNALLYYELRQADCRRHGMFCAKAALDIATMHFSLHDTVGALKVLDEALPKAQPGRYLDELTILKQTILSSTPGGI